ncbi:hypothetical protein [Rhizobium herbae]|uniref:Lipoprotein n=1 Tax=Rhizobium herbae TaxID=508661 RepID=A0ABS4EFP5_9HYPH|nr:hypothetical protein [Rhizobium herbae]MBP1856762.1 hypothetical protein [Rhizobium herbae]
MKSLILATAIGLSCLTIAGCVSESSSYDGGYNGRPRDYSDRYDRPNDRLRERNDYVVRRNDGRAERRERDYRRGDRRCVGDPRCEVPEYNAERPGYYRRDGQAQGY